VKKAVLLIILVLLIPASIGLILSTPSWIEGRLTSIFNEEPVHHNQDSKKEKEQRPKEATILATGDIMVHSRQFNEAKERGDNADYCFSGSFKHITPYLKKADLAVANLETTFGGGRPRGYPRFSAPDELASDLEDAGFDLLCTANNHSLDTGKEGLYRTLEVIEEENLKPFGTFRSREERDAPLLVDVNGIKVAFLAYTDSTNAIPVPEGKDYIVNLIEVDSEEGLQEAEKLIEADILTARDKGADIVAVYMHWGWEYHLPGPNPVQERLAKKVARLGGDIVFGSHPHVIQPMEFIETEKECGNTRETLVVYSMGNFISNQHKIPGSIPTEEVKYGLSVRVHLKKDKTGNSAEIDEVDYIISWVNRDHKHQVIPVHNLLDADPGEYNIPGDKLHKYERIEPVTIKTMKRLEEFQPVSSLIEVIEN